MEGHCVSCTHSTHCPLVGSHTCPPVQTVPPETAQEGTQNG
jgi:hypothetical protein